VAIIRKTPPTATAKTRRNAADEGVGNQDGRTGFRRAAAGEGHHEDDGTNDETARAHRAGDPTFAGDEVPPSVEDAAGAGHVRRLAGLAVVLVLGASCGGGEAKTPAATPPATADPTTGTTRSTADLAGRYLEFGTAVNEAQRIFEEKQAAIFRTGTTIGVAQYADLAEPYADVMEQSANRLSELAWPDSMRRHVDALVSAETSIVRDLRSARASSVLRLEEVTEGMVSENMAASLAGDLLRADLGLPPA